MNKREYMNAIAPLAAAFGRKMPKEQHIAFYSVLKDFEVAPFKRAIIAFLAEGDDWPTIAKLRRLTTEQIEGSVQPHGEAFDHIMKQVRSYGYPHKDRLDQILTQDEISVIDQVGGWIRFCDCTSNERGTLAAQFRDAWKEHVGGRRRRENLPAEARPKLSYMKELLKLAESKRITEDTSTRSGDQNDER